MANDLYLSQVTGGLKIVSENSSQVLNEYSTKRNNIANDEIAIISDVKNSYSEFNINFEDYDNVYFDGNVVADAETLESTLEALTQKLDVNVQDQTTPSIEHFLWEDKNDVVITSNLSRGDNVIPLQAGHNIVNASGFDRDYINIYYSDSDVPGDFVNNRFSQHAVVGINTNDISVTPPIAYDLDTTKVVSSKRVNVNMAQTVATFASPITFKAYPPPNIQWDLTRLIADKILTSAGDDGKFGNIAALQNGIYFGFENVAFAEYQLAIFDNGGWRATAFDVNYTIRSGGTGDYGMAIRKTSAGQDKLGVAIRLDAATNDVFVSRVQDDVTLIPRFRVKIMGHIVD
jgi:hypothetical protein